MVEVPFSLRFFSREVHLLVELSIAVWWEGLGMCGIPMYLWPVVVCGLPQSADTPNASYGAAFRFLHVSFCLLKGSLGICWLKKKPGQVDFQLWVLILSILSHLLANDMMRVACHGKGNTR